MSVLRVVLLAFVGLLIGAFFASHAGGLPAGAIRERVKSQVVILRGSSGGGTGFAIQTSSGKVFLLTNNHVCANSFDGNKLLGQSQEGDFGAEVIKTKHNPDLCLLKADKSFTGLRLARSVEMGATVHVLGHPRLFPLKHTVGHLIDVVRLRDFHPTFGFYMMLAYMSDVLVLPGSSGSPVVDNHADVVGVVFAASGPKAFFIPLVSIQDFLVDF